MEPLTVVHPLGCDFTLEAPSRHQEWHEHRGYEPTSTALFRTACTGADVVLDLGAHMGYYTLVAAGAAPKAQLIAVEGSPDNAAVAARNLAANGVTHAEVINAAFTEVAGTVRFQLTEASDNNGLSGHPNSATFDVVEVAAITADQLALRAGHRLVIKLDVEGHEQQALNGLQHTLARYADVRLLIEFNPKALRHAGEEPSALMERLLTDGFRIFLVDEHAHSWQEVRRPDDWQQLMAPEAYANLYCVRTEACHVVAVVMHSNGLGGSERSQIELTHSLIRQGCMVHTVIPHDAGALGAPLQQIGGSISVVDSIGWWYSSGPKPAASWAGHVSNLPLLKALAQLNPDVVVTQTGVTPDAAICAAALGYPHLWYLREFGDRDHGLELPLPPHQLGALVRQLSTQVLTNSELVGEHFFAEPDPAVTVIPPAPQLPDLIRPAQQRPWKIGVVGTIGTAKGQGEVIDAVALLRRNGLDVPLVLVGGEDSRSAAAVHARCHDGGVEDLVEFIGQVSLREDLYSRFDAVVISSVAEAYGRVPFEATAAGLPVIYADTAGPARYLRDGETGLSYPPGDVDTLAGLIARLHSDPGLGDRFVEAARRDLLAPERLVAFDRAVLEVISTAIAQGPSRSPVAMMLGESLRHWAADADTITELQQRLVAEQAALQVATDHGETLAAQLLEASRERARLDAEIEQHERDFSRVRRERNQARKQLKKLRSSRVWRLRNRLVKLLRLQR